MKNITDKQKLILYMTYTMYYLPIQIFVNMPITFSESNIKYKLIPRLIKTGMIKRERVGYNRTYNHNLEQKGKALYDVLILTNKGIHYVKEQILGTGKEIEMLRNFYHRQAYANTELTEERLKKTILCDFMFDPFFTITPIIKNFKLKPKTRNELFKDLSSKRSCDYFHGIECKRRNGNLEELKNVKSIKDYTSKTGLSISNSKFLGILQSEYKTFPIYFSGYKNLTIYPKSEENLINKIIAQTGRQCNDAIYVFQSKEKIKQLIERDEILEEWKKTSNIIDILDYQRIYLIPYGMHSTEFEHLKIQMSIDYKDMRPYWQASNCFENHDYILAQPFVKDALRNSQDFFMSVTDEYNYIIGYLPELRHLRKVFRYYEENKEAKPLVIVCDEEQTNFYEKIFEKIMNNDKLYFHYSKFTDKGGNSNIKQ